MIRIVAATRRQEKRVEGRIDTTHNRYRIVGGQRDGICQAIAYLGRRRVYEANGETVAAAVDSLKRTLDEHIDRLIQERVEGVPCEAEFREALLALAPALTAETMKLLVGQSRLPGGAISVGELARRSGRDEATVVADYARLGRKLAAPFELCASTGRARTVARVDPDLRVRGDIPRECGRGVAPETGSARGTGRNGRGDRDRGVVIRCRMVAPRNPARSMRRHQLANWRERPLARATQGPRADIAVGNNVGSRQETARQATSGLRARPPGWGSASAKSGGASCVS